MKVTVVGMLCCLLSLACTDKQKTFLPEAVPASAIAVIGGSEQDTTALTVEGNKAIAPQIQDRDTVIYEMPSYYLWYRKDLPKSYRKQEHQFRTERKVYWQDVKVINVFLANYTDVPLEFNGDWELQQWNGQDWEQPQLKHLPDTAETEWINDEQAHRLYCFRIPVGDFYYLPKGRYRINKLVAPHNQHVICLSAQFEIP